MNVVLLVRMNMLRSWAPLLGISPFLAILLGLASPIFASNVILLAVMCFAGQFVGTGVGNLRNWPGAILVPGYARGLFTASLVTLTIAALAWGVVFTAAGNPKPALGPGLLAGSLVALGFVRFAHSPQVLVASLLFLYGLLLGGIIVVLATTLTQVDDVFMALSNPWANAGSLVGTGIALGALWRVINSPIPGVRPDIPSGAGPLQPSGITTTRGRHQPPRWVQTAFGSAAIVGLAALLRLWEPSTFVGTLLFMFPWMGAVFVGAFGSLGHLHATFHFHWFLEVADSRTHLARRGAATTMQQALAWLPAGLAGAAILAYGNGDQLSLFEEVLIAQTWALVVIVIATAGVKRLPIAPSRLTWTSAIMAGFGGALVPLTQLDLAATGYSVLILALVGSACVASVLVRRTLSQADVLV